jgi:general secretion pathway protein K
MRFSFLSPRRSVVLRLWQGFCLRSSSGVGLSLLSCWFISVPPVRGGTYFSLPAAKKSRQKKAAQTANAKRVPRTANRSGASGISAPAHSPSVTKQSSAPAALRAPNGTSQTIECSSARASAIHTSSDTPASARRVVRRVAEAKPTAPTAQSRSHGFSKRTRPASAQREAGGMTALSLRVGDMGARIPDAPLPPPSRGTHLSASGLSCFLLPTFLCSRQRKVGAPPHRGNANKPTRKQGKANTGEQGKANPEKQGKTNPGEQVKANATGKQANNQRGAAIISALLVVALAAILVSGMLWRQQVQIRRIENQRLLSQAQWIGRGALDWTRLILRSEGDTSAGITYLGGLWGVPIAKTRLSDFLGQIGEVRAEQGQATYLSGSIEDAQAKFNLRNLVSSPAPGVMQLNMEQVGAYQRLLVSLGMNSQLAKTTALQVRSSLAQSATRFQTVTSAAGTTATPITAGGGAIGGSFTDKPGIEDGDDNSAVAPLQMTSVDSLLDIPGYTPEMVARLRPFVTVLPTVSAVNMNTASAEVVAAIVPGMNLSAAQAFVARRQTVFFHNVSDVQLALRGAGVQSMSIDPNQMDVNTSYFLIHGRVQHERAEVDRTTLVYRDALTHTTRIVRVQDQL